MTRVVYKIQIDEKAYLKNTIVIYKLIFGKKYQCNVFWSFWVHIVKWGFTQVKRGNLKILLLTLKKQTAKIQQLRNIGSQVWQQQTLFLQVRLVMSLESDFCFSFVEDIDEWIVFGCGYTQ